MITKYRKQGILLLPLDARKLKGFQLQGGFAPLIPRPGALPLDPRYRLALHALAMCPSQIQFLDPSLPWTPWELSSPRPLLLCHLWSPKKFLKYALNWRNVKCYKGDTTTIAYGPNVNLLLNNVAVFNDFCCNFFDALHNTSPSRR